MFDTTVVAVETDARIIGYAECYPLCLAYLPAYALGVYSGLQEIGPKLLGMDPTNLGEINRQMDAVLRGHNYIKASIDIACWDILGKLTGLPVYALLSSVAQDRVMLYRAISQQSPEEMAAKIAGYRAEGYTKFQLKVGGSAEDDIARIRACRAILSPSDTLVANANTGWNRAEAARVVAAVADLDVYIEQPCMTYEECISIWRRTSRPFILDEMIDNVGSLVKGLADDAMDVINLKISKVGGLIKARLMRDLAVASGIPMTIENTWSGDITTVAITQSLLWPLPIWRRRRARRSGSIHAGLLEIRACAISC